MLSYTETGSIAIPLDAKEGPVIAHLDTKGTPTGKSN